MYFPCTIRYTHFRNFPTDHLILLLKNNDINNKLFYPKSAYNSIDRHKMHHESIGIILLNTENIYFQKSSFI